MRAYLGVIYSRCCVGGDHGGRVWPVLGSAVHEEGWHRSHGSRGTPGAYTVGVRRVNELDFYNLSLNQLAERVGLTPPKTTAVVRFLELVTDPDCCKEIAIGKSRFVRYSQKAIGIIRQELARTPIDRIWATHGPKRKAAPAREFYSRN